MRKTRRFRVIRALEHQVFEEMGDAGLAGRFIGGAGAVPDHVHDGGAAVVLDHDDLHAVVEKEFRDVLRRLNGRGEGKRERRDKRRGDGATGGAAFGPSGENTGLANEIC
jgi:hypothetical protein